MSTKLTPHFTLEELTKTKTGIENLPNASQTNALRILCRDILEPLRDKIGKPIIIDSAFPLVGLLNPLSIRMAVVFPAPLAPRKPKISPRFTSNDILSTAVNEPNRLVS